jgi:hypothetical protein
MESEHERHVLKGYKSRRKIKYKVEDDKIDKQQQES